MTMDREDLEAIPGIGKAPAEKIQAIRRDRHRPASLHSSPSRASARRRCDPPRSVHDRRHRHRHHRTLRTGEPAPARSRGEPRRGRGEENLPADAGEADTTTGRLSIYRTEEEVFATPGMAAVPLELWEDRGEVEEDIIGHPTARLLRRQPATAIDMARVIDAAAATGTALEINASQARMDLDDIYIRQAKEKGVKLAIGTDAHSAGELGHMHYGVALARRGWCSVRDVLNTRRPADLPGRCR